MAYQSEEHRTRSSNIFLLPNTIDYYQFQITELLERERYGEAKELLKFLLDCRTSETETMEEWRALLDWLERNSRNSMSPKRKKPKRISCAKHCSPVRRRTNDSWSIC